MDKRRRRLRPDLYLEETASNSATRVAAPAPTANAPAKSGFGGPKPTSVGVAPAYGFGGPRPGGCAVPAPGAARPAGAEPSRPRASSLKAIVHAPCTRSDVPVVRNLRRGSAADAVASLHRLGAAALEADLHKDKVAKTSVAPAESVWKTWQGFHRDVFGSTEDALPITPQKLVSVGSMFKAGGYRSFPNYATGAKNAHIEAKHHWCQLLEHTRAWVTRSVSRGIGPSRQSCSWSFHKLLTMLQSPAPLSKGGAASLSTIRVAGYDFHSSRNRGEHCRALLLDPGRRSVGAGVEASCHKDRSPRSRCHPVASVPMRDHVPLLPIPPSRRPC